MQVDLMPIEKLGRHIKLAPRRVDRKGAQDRSNAGGEPGRFGDCPDVNARDNPRGEYLRESYPLEGFEEG